MQDTLAEFLVACIELEASRKVSIVQCVLDRHLKDMVEYRDSRFERVYPVKTKVADMMLKSGYKLFSKLGKWCPVKVC